MDVHVRYVASSFDEFLLWNHGPIADPSVTFDLGVNGILDVTFASFPSTTAGAFEGSHAGRGNSGTVSATFLLRDVPQLPAAIPEPSILLLLGSGLGLLGAALGRRRHDVISRFGT